MKISLKTGYTINKDNLSEFIRFEIVIFTLQSKKLF